MIIVPIIFDGENDWMEDFLFYLVNNKIENIYMSRLKLCCYYHYELKYLIHNTKNMSQWQIHHYLSYLLDVISVKKS